MHVSYHSLLEEPKVLIEFVNTHFGVNFTTKSEFSADELKVPYSKGGYRERLEIYGGNDYGLPERVVSEYREALNSCDIRFLETLGYSVLL